MLDSEMKKVWGDKLFEINKKGFDRTEESELRDLYKKLIDRREPASLNEVAKGLREYFKGTQMNSGVNEITLGEGFNTVSPQALLRASERLLNINKGDEEEDERDSLIFKNIYAPDDLLGEYFKAHTPTIQKKLQNALSNREQVREVVPSNVFTKPVREFFTRSDLSSTPPQTNPVAMVVNARKTTSMGEGGIQNMHSITMDTRDVQPSHFGFLDPLSTPEGLKVGVNVGLASEVRKVGNEMATPVITPEGKEEYKTPMDIYNNVVGFPDQFKMKKGKPVPISNKIKVMKKHEPAIVPKGEVDFYLASPAAMFDFGTNLVPFLDNTQGNRGSTAARMITQALPLDEGETPHTVVERDKKTTYEDLLGSYLLPSLEQETGDSKVGGEVKKIDKDYIHIKADDGKDYKVGLYNEFPLNEDGYLNTTPIVEVGDKVKGSDVLARSNYTDDSGRLALGRNLNVAYVSYKGNSFEDAATITESAAKKLSHTTIDRINIFINPKQSVLNLTKFKAHYPEEITASNARKLNDNGLPKIGETFNEGEALAVFLVKKEIDDLDLSFRKLDKAIYTPYAKNVTHWDESDPGEVVDVRQSGRNIDIYVKSTHPFKEGDKLSGKFGDKHIVGKIIPDDEAPHRQDGTPVDIMVNPQGVQGRMNMGQLLEAAANKLAIEKGETIKVKNFKDEDDDVAREVWDQLKEAGIEANEVLIDGKTGKPLENPVFVGNRQYIKLRHLVKKKEGAHDYGVYDLDEQPAKKGAQMLGTLDSYSYLAHGAKNLLREATQIKGRKNEEWFRDLQFGLPPGKPNDNFVFNKVLDYMRASGVDTRKEGNKFQLLPLTDKRVEELSAGELTDPGAMLIGKNLASRKGGLFDKDLTGGQQGEKYTHISLPTRLPNPMAEDAIMSVLELTNKDYEAIMKGKKEIAGATGAEGIVKALEALDVSKEFESAKEELKGAPESRVNKLNTKVRILDALNKEGLNPKDAYTMDKVLVIPPKFRPIYPLPSGDLQVSDLNKHYRDVGLQAKGLKEVLDEDLITDDERISYEDKLYYSIKAMQGKVDPITYGKQKYKGALKDLGHTKKGLIFGKAWAKRQDLSGRSTITPEPSLGLDEVGIPEGIAKKVYKPFMVRKLKERGLPASKALKEVNEYTDLAQKSLQEIMREKPVVLNRAPSLHKHSVQAFMPKLTDGKEIQLNPLVVSGFNADFDGDTMSVMVPVTYEGEQDARSMFPSKILFKHGDKGLVPSISQEYTFGVSKLSELGKNTGKKFKTIQEAKEAGLGMTDVFELDGQKMTLGQWELNKVLPEKYRDYSRTFKGKQLKNLFDKVAREEDSGTFKTMLERYKDLGASYSYKYGGTVSIEDMVLDRSYRDDLIKKYAPKIEKIKDEDKRTEAWSKLVEDIEDAQNKVIKDGNRFWDLIDTGALSASKAGNVRQVLTAPGVVADTKGKAVPIPVLKSYSEGLGTFDYFNTMPGVRKGIVDKSVNTQESGALNKTLLSVNRRLLVTEEDCDTGEGLEFDINSNDIMDRALLETVRGVGRRNDIVDSSLINKAKRKGIEKLKVRSALTCESVEGVCQKCYGALPSGRFPDIGTNVGVLDSQALTERSTQLTLSTFHCMHGDNLVFIKRKKEAKVEVITFSDL